MGVVHVSTVRGTSTTVSKQPPASIQQHSAKKLVLRISVD